jgi:HPt (histidine-containing phosphotransfer) domain-containing protein
MPPLDEGARAHLQSRLDDLARMGGAEARDRLVGRFHDQLCRQLAACAKDGLALAAEAHRLAGLAGMFGFEALERACRAVEDAPKDPAPAAAACLEMEAATAVMGEMLGRSC